jgi:2-phosphosulfolactate phosphatase
MDKTMVQVVLTPDQIDRMSETDLSDATCVVFDVLRATSTMVTALAGGAAAVHPVRTIDEALKKRESLGGNVLLGGERGGDRIEGFDLGNSPLEYTTLPSGVHIVTTTTNGTVALRACDGACRTLVGSLLNLDAVADSITSKMPPRLVIVCGGTQRAMALEDVLGAGALISQLPDWPLDDAAQLAVAYYKATGGRVSEVLRKSQNGRSLLAKEREQDVEWCAQVSVMQIVPVLVGGVVRVETVAGEGCCA